MARPIRGQADRPQRGRIVWANFVDPQGNDSGRHPAVIISQDAEIRNGESFWVAVVSTKLHHAAAQDMVELLWSPLRLGHPLTRLKRKCAVICTWREKIMEADIEEYAGRVYGEYLDKILARVDELLRQDNGSTEPESTQS